MGGRVGQWVDATAAGCRRRRAAGATAVACVHSICPSLEMTGDGLLSAGAVACKGKQALTPITFCTLTCKVSESRAGGEQRMAHGGRQ